MTGNNFSAPAETPPQPQRVANLRRMMDMPKAVLQKIIKGFCPPGCGLCDDLGGTFPLIGKEDGAPTQYAERTTTTADSPGQHR